MEKKIAILSELIEQCSEANKLVISNAIAMENGDIVLAQKHLKEASNLLATMIKDTFQEVKQMVSEDTSSEETYDFSTLDIAKILSKVCFHSASLINCYIGSLGGTVTSNTEMKLIKCINSATALAKALLLN